MGLVYHESFWLGVCSEEIVSCCPNWFHAYMYSSFGNRILECSEVTGHLVNLFGVSSFRYFLLAVWIEGLVNITGFSCIVIYLV